jgi:hypothetical protein
MSLVVWLRAPLGLPTIVMVWMLAFGIVAGLPLGWSRYCTIPASR